MIKHFCDGCCEEVDKNVVLRRPRSESIYLNGRTGFRVEIMSGTANSWNVGELCKGCLFKLVKILLNVE